MQIQSNSIQKREDYPNRKQNARLTQASGGNRELPDSLAGSASGGDASQMKDTVTLAKSPGGRLVPNLPQPKTAAEAEVYLAAELRAAEANSILTCITNLGTRYSHQDNGMKDLDSQENVIVLAGHPEGRNDIQEAVTLRVSPATHKKLFFERQATGKVDGRDAEDKFTYVASPLYLEYSSASQHSKQPSLFNFSLREDTNGLVVFETSSTGRAVYSKSDALSQTWPSSYWSWAIPMDKPPFG